MNDRVTVWWMDVRQTPDAALSRWLGLLDMEEQTKAARFHFAADRCQYIAAHCLARTMLSASTGIARENLCFCRDAKGRPELTGETGLRFSLSHTRSLVACAVSNVDAVGLDVESLDRSAAGLEIAQSCFAAAEVALVQQFGQEAFLRLWTLKEAFLKATGDGLRRPLNSFSFSLEPIRLDDGEGGSGWRFAQFSPLAGHLLAVALRCSGPGEALVESRQIGVDEL
jgi:4'-phosphopantetheinyl transferase